MVILNVYAFRVAKHVEQKLIEPERETDKSTVKSGDFNIPLSTISRTGLPWWHSG